jgi:hypothetical protein
VVDAVNSPGTVGCSSPLETLAVIGSSRDLRPLTAQAVTDLD